MKNKLNNGLLKELTFSVACYNTKSDQSILTDYFVSSSPQHCSSLTTSIIFRQKCQLTYKTRQAKLSVSISSPQDKQPSSFIDEKHFTVCQLDGVETKALWDT